MTANTGNIDPNNLNQYDPNQIGNFGSETNIGFNPSFINNQNLTQTVSPSQAAPKSNMLEKLSQRLGQTQDNSNSFQPVSQNTQPTQNYSPNQTQYYPQSIPMETVTNPQNPFIFNPNQTNSIQNLNNGGFQNSYNNQAQYYPQTIPHQVAPTQDNFNPYYNQFGQSYNPAPSFEQNHYSTEFYNENSNQDFNNLSSFSGGVLPVPTLNPVNPAINYPQYNPNQFLPAPSNNAFKPEDFAFTNQVSKPQGNIEPNNIQNTVSAQLAESKTVTNFAQAPVANNIVQKPASLQTTPSEKQLQLHKLKPDPVSKIEKNDTAKGIELIEANGCGAVSPAEGLFKSARMRHIRITNT